MTMTEKYKILAKFVKDMSSETPDIDTYLFVKDNISKYTLNIDIKTKRLKDKIYQVETTLGYSDKTQNTKKSFLRLAASCSTRKFWTTFQRYQRTFAWY